MEMTFYNPTGQMTLSADGLTYSYIGTAAQQSIVQAGFDPGSSTQKSSGYTTYVIAWAGDIIPVIPINTKGMCSIVDYTQSNGVWTIRVYNGNGTAVGNDFEVQEYTTVYVFGAPSVGTTSMFMLYNDNGVPSADLSKQPLTYKGILAMGANVLTTVPPSGLPFGIIGNPTDNYWTYVSDPGGYTAVYRSRGWHYNSSTGQVERNLYTYQTARSPFTLADKNDIFAVTAMYVDLSGLA